jgi:hypothetical protein
VPTMGTCDSCGRDDEETVAVRRVYLVLPEGVTADPVTLEEQARPVTLDTDEQWCATCRDQFPHAAAGV